MPSDPGTHRSSDRAAVLFIERDRALAALYCDSVRTQLPSARVAASSPDSDTLARAWSAADLAVCSAGDCQRTRFDDLDRLALARPDGRIVLLIPGDARDCVEEAFERGARDVLIKTPGYLEQLPTTVAKNLLFARREAERERRLFELHANIAAVRRENLDLGALVARLKSLSITDPLTGLSNRLGIRQRLDEFVSSAARYHADLSVLMVDLDGLKAVNDLLGHQAGDDALRAAAECIRSGLRRADAAGRIGGDEFVVALPHTPADRAAAVADRILARFRAVAAPIQQRIEAARTAPGVVRVIGRTTRPADGPLDMTIGVASLLSAASPTADGLLADADRALYSGKRSGKGRVVIHQPDASRPVIQPGLLRAG